MTCKDHSIGFTQLLPPIICDVSSYILYMMQTQNVLFPCWFYTAPHILEQLRTGSNRSLCTFVDVTRSTLMSHADVRLCLTPPCPCLKSFCGWSLQCKSAANGFPKLLLIWKILYFEKFLYFIERYFQQNSLNSGFPIFVMSTWSMSLVSSHLQGLWWEVSFQDFISKSWFSAGFKNRSDFVDYPPPLFFLL